MKTQLCEIRISDYFSCLFFFFFAFFLVIYCPSHLLGYEGMKEKRVHVLVAVFSIQKLVILR